MPTLEPSRSQGSSYVAPADCRRPHKHVRFHKPADHKRRPGVLNATCDGLKLMLEDRQGLFWRFARSIIVAGYPIARALHRVRALRTDGAAALLAVATVLLYSCDIRTGFVGRPRPGGGPWHRFTVRDIAQLAFGSQTPGDLRRVRRALDVLTGLHWLYPTKQVRRHAGENDFRSEPAVRRLNLMRICKMAGSEWLLARDRKHADQKYGTGATSMEDGRARRQERREQPFAAARDSTHRHSPPSTGDPPRGAGGAQRIASILDLLKS